MLIIAYGKSFEDKPKFESHYAYKPNHILLNYMKFLRR
jgi:hypothetical protein